MFELAIAALAGIGLFLLLRPAPSQVVITHEAAASEAQDEDGRSAVSEGQDSG